MTPIMSTMRAAPCLIAAITSNTMKKDPKRREAIGNLDKKAFILGFRWA
jgi:hypothetical protein